MIEFIQPYKEIIDAAREYKHLIDRAYKKHYALRTVTEKYGLRDKERMMIYRSVKSEDEKRDLKEKCLKSVFLIAQEDVYIDFYNIAILLDSGFTGKLITMGNDQFIRDIRGLHRKLSKFS